MKITNFEGPELYDVALWLENNKSKTIDKDILKEILKTINIAFVVEGINRIQSTLLCELKDSYVQQSQRYVTMDKSSYEIPELNEIDNIKAEELIEKAFKLYGKMSEPKAGKFEGRPKAENYKYGIPIEDARYILPLATKTNMSIAMTGDKLYNLFLLINDKKYCSLFDDFRKEIVGYLPKILVKQLPAFHDSTKETQIIEQFYDKYMEKIDEENNMVYINGFENLDLKAGLGALTSTSSDVPSEILAKWGNNADEKAKGVTKRVLGYGHNSIAEQARTTFGMMCSMVTYHQQIRHRLPENHREDILNVITDTKRDVIIPPSIKKSGFCGEFLNLANEFKDFKLYILNEYGGDKALPFILNCDQIKLIISTNARIDSEMLADRICFNAQWEIRNLSIKKLKILRNLSDILYETALPACIKGECREGKLSCGRQREMRKMFSKR
ncbi:MAG: FAD-dependent thymidylate synthase [Candidatus Alkaliphilus sp. MAG34]|nr:FAD-dependent thymidylate synthase [Clostridiales bacterium]